MRLNVKEQNRSSRVTLIQDTVSNMLAKGQDIWSVSQVTSIATQNGNQELSESVVSSVMKNQFNLSYRKIGRIPI